MMKLVVIINGNGGVGKDTLCDFAGQVYKVRNISAIEPIKKIAGEHGWKGEKDPKSRKFLADLKRAFVAYNDLPYRYLCQEYEAFLKTDEQILFVHIREGEEIEKFKRHVQLPCVTMLITRRQASDVFWGNEADDQVNRYAYDYTYRNDKQLEEAQREFVQFLMRIYNECKTGKKQDRWNMRACIKKEDPQKT